MDNYDQAYDNYGGSQGGGGSTKSCTPRQRLVWQSIAWAFFLTGEAALFALWFSWGCGAHNDPWAPMFNVSLIGRGTTPVMRQRLADWRDICVADARHRCIPSTI